VWYNRYRKISFSQSGEDCIIDFIFKQTKIDKPGYIDIGAFHPFELSNTAKFYLTGSRGINVEPNPDQYKYFTSRRRRDKNLNIGIGAKKGTLLYYKMNVPTLNTFNAAAAKELVEKHGFSITEQIELPVEDLRTVIAEQANNRFPDFLSLDAEGLDEEILTQVDFDNNYPKVICVETIEYSHHGGGKKNNTLIDFLLEKDYMLYADTRINSIFVNRKFWR
jgi:FkbM family methyltransferase